MANEKVFAKGIRTFPKHVSAPDFVLGDVVISMNELNEWANGEGSQYLSDYKGDKQIKLQVTSGRDGSFVLSVNTYKKQS